MVVTPFREFAGRKYYRIINAIDFSFSCRYSPGNGHMTTVVYIIARLSIGDNHFIGEPSGNIEGRRYDVIIYVFFDLNSQLRKSRGGMIVVIRLIITRAA